MGKNEDEVCLLLHLILKQTATDNQYPNSECVMKCIKLDWCVMCLLKDFKLLIIFYNLFGQLLLKCFMMCLLCLAKKTNKESELQSEEDRAKWENSFNLIFIQPILAVSICTCELLYSRIYLTRKKMWQIWQIFIHLWPCPDHTLTIKTHCVCLFLPYGCYNLTMVDLQLLEWERASNSSS